MHRMQVQGSTPVSTPLCPVERLTTYLPMPILGFWMGMVVYILPLVLYTLQDRHNDYPNLFTRSTSSTAYLFNSSTSLMMMWLAPNHSNFHSNSVVNLDIDSEIQPSSISSSPQSTISSIPISSFHSFSASKIPRAVQNEVFNFSAPATTASLAPSANMMYTDAWVHDGRFGTKATARGLHNRDSSMSSIGSHGPQSPYSYNSANPQIAVSDSGDAFHGLSMADDQSYQLVAKVPNAASHDTFYANYPYTDTTNMQSYSHMQVPQKSRSDRGALLPAPDFSSGGSSNSRPASVASSIASDSPATPVAPEPSEDEKRRKAGEDFFLQNLPVVDCQGHPRSPSLHQAGLIHVPKLARTVTDVYNDELFNPNFAASTTSPSQPTITSMSPTHEIFSQRVQAANSQHLNTTQSPLSSNSRGRSPFKQSSPLAPAPAQDFPQVSNNMRFDTAQQVRERRKAEQESVQALRPTMAQSINGSPNNNTTNNASHTISPQDALLEFNDADGTNNFPLFPSTQSAFDTTQLSKAASHASNFGPLSLDTAFDAYMPSQLSAGLQLPQQYPFVSKHRQQPSLPSVSNGSFSVSSHVGSSPSTSTSPPASASPQRPGHVGADGGTYTCTYHGCTQRFETPALLQKHKREGHRQAHGLNGLRRPDGPTPTYFNTQAGPHKCERINPSTGKPCQTVFSRPYDLTRHEDTIHNARKQKVRCDVCTEEKTFSRADALTRHYRVCHPDLEFPGKHRKRGGAGN